MSVTFLRSTRRTQDWKGTICQSQILYYFLSLLLANEAPVGIAVGKLSFPMANCPYVGVTSITSGTFLSEIMALGMTFTTVVPFSTK